MNISLAILSIIWFLIHAGVANMAAGVSGKFWPKFNLPLDFGYKFRNKRIFGDHKTVRGILIGTIFGYVSYIFQNYLISNVTILKTITINNFENNYILGFVLPMGALFGDAIKSFFKRQFNIVSGKSWFPFDQLDWVLGTLIASFVFVRFDIFFALLTIIVGLALHITIKVIGYTFRLQDEKF